MICPVCHKSIKPGLDITHSCGHQSHALCLDQVNPNFEMCDKCLNKSVDTLDVEKKQPTSLNGRDYVVSPANRLWSKITRKVEKLNSKLPLEHLMAEHNYDLQYLLSQGVTLDEMLHNGYTIEDLELYDDFAGRNGRKRSKQALIALDAQVQHFRDYPKLLSKLEHPKDLITDFGLYFPEDNALSLSVYGKELEQPFTLRELCEMGWTKKELFGAGLEYIEQYEDLMPDKESQRKMGIKRKDLDNLLTCEPVYYAPVRTRDPEPQIIVVEKPVNSRRKYHGLKKNK